MDPGVFPEVLLNTVREGNPQGPAAILEHVHGLRNRMKAVIPAAGLGTRFLPLTKEQPKEMLPVVDRPAIHWVVEEAIAADVTDLR